MTAASRRARLIASQRWDRDPTATAPPAGHPGIPRPRIALALRATPINVC